MAAVSAKPRHPARHAKKAHAKSATSRPSSLLKLKQPVAKTTDSKGRVILGGRFANRAVIVEWVSETEMIVKLARVIPEREAWLYENPEALGGVRKGLAQARLGKVTSGPDVDADAEFAARLEG